MPRPARKNFLTEIIDADLAAGRHERVVTRFPPEPNGWLHIGHAKSICLNFGLAEDYGGDCHLRFDDTNPVTEDETYVQAIEDDVRWLGFEWTGPVRFASDYFGFMYDYAVGLIRAGKAYVDEQSADEVRETRGTPYEPGRNSPFRDRPVEESLALFERMRAGELPDGAAVLRAKIDMASPNILMRDPPLYRIKHAPHHRTGDAWCLYPMYDFAHCLEDAFEGVTHSICTLEFQDNRELYDWVLDHGDPPARPRQYEFARLNLGYTVMSKRKLLQLVENGHVSGWDDPRMPTLAGLRRRGVTPEAIRAFCAMIGVAKTDSTVDVGKLEYCIRDDLNARAPRAMAVLRPLRLTLTDWPAGEVETLDAPSWPEDVGKPGSRPLPLARDLLVERDDFADDPPRGWKRLAPGATVRLRHGPVVRCDEVVRDEHGAVVELRCSRVADARPRGTIHWVSAAHALPAEVRLVDRLFAVEKPGADPEIDFREQLNPHSLEVLTDARVEPSVADAPADTRWQFERQGYFRRDPVDGTGDRLVFDRIVTLKDSWAKADAPAPARGKKAKPAPPAPRGPVVAGRDEARAADPELAARHARYVGELSLSPGDADVLSGDRATADFFEAALAAHDAPASVAKWLVNELRGAHDGEPPFDAAAFAALVRLVDEGAITTRAGKDVLAEMLAGGGDPEAIVDARGLRTVADDAALGAMIDDVLARHADEVARYRAGEAKLLGLFIGEVMKASGGAADPQATRALLAEKLG